MHPQIKRHLDTIKESGEAIGRHPEAIERMQNQYLEGMTTNRKAVAIKAFCHECMGYDSGLVKSIRTCTDRGCPLFNHRPYRMKGQGVPEMAHESTLESTISENMTCG